MAADSVKWTEQQQQVIESRGTNLLVSAAAGSGKTAVLVERIIRMITDKKNPVDIDRLLVMTFTKAAAAEMRERIGAAIEKELQNNPEDAHLQMQAALVHHAQITTIDSFCLSVIRENFNLVDLDPAFRVGDEGELLLLRKDVMEDLLEDYYALNDTEFERFVESYSVGKQDFGLSDYIMQVYNFSQSNPYPQQWLDSCKRELSPLSEEQKENREGFPWMDFLKGDLKKQLEELALQMREALEVCEMDEALMAYIPMLSHDLSQIQGIAKEKEFAQIHEKLLAFQWDRLATVKNSEVEAERKAFVTGCRDRAKKVIGKMKEMYCFASVEEMFEDLSATGPAIGVLVRLVEEFTLRYQEVKKERNLVDFNDLEHEAIHILAQMEDGKITYTEAADTLSTQFEEILVDEYQDSNLVQECLIHAVSRERFGKNNVFMVGDVKQSIYRFRLARPELFLEKYDTYEPYEAGSGTNRKIELRQNFRSRRETLEGINDVFYKIMTAAMGDICYDHGVALHPGAKFPERNEGKCGTRPELLVVSTGNEALNQLDEDAADFTSKEIEARLIANKIKEMTDSESGVLVWDKKLKGTGGYRRAQYRDMVILLRSTSGWTENFLTVLTNLGIPAYAESRTGYFNTTEVETVLSFLSIIDNPMQDIPLAAVLKSPVVGLDDQELAHIMAIYRTLLEKGQDRGIYAAVQHYRQTQEDLVASKLNFFWKLLETLRRKSAYLPIYELIYLLYDESGYYDYASAMPAGEARKANLDMLVEKAADYEKTSYKGLFHFVRYIENLKKYDTDFGEASIVGEDDNTVRIMSIHKSKGLEFPIVFLAGMGKKFNKQDVYSRLLIDPALGIGTDYMDLDRRLKTATLKKNVMRRKMELDALGEELRVLYVAMTRAKEQLIMTGTDRYLDKTMEKFEFVPSVDGQIPYTVLSTAGSYLDWVFMALGAGEVRIGRQQVPLQEVVGGEVIRQTTARQSRESLEKLDLNKIYDEEYEKDLKARLNFQYKWLPDITLHTKMSVSELKKQEQKIDYEESKQLIEKPADGRYKVKSGAARGTVYHKVLELISFHEISSEADAEKALEILKEEGKLTDEDYQAVDANDIWRFLDSKLGRRMRWASQGDRLYKEQQFVMGIPARDMGVADSDELVVIQGIIDAFFEENGELILVDYKTDNVQSADRLVEYYKKQLDYYELSITMMKKMPVMEKLIYSFALHEVVHC